MAYRSSHSSQRSTRVKRLALVALLVALPLIFFSLYRIGPAPRIETELDRPGIGKIPLRLQATVQEPERGLSRVRVDLVQGEEVHTLYEESLTQPPSWAFWRRPDPEHRIDLTIGQDDLPQKTSGPITLRLTAAGAGTPLRHPRQTLSELSVPVQLTPPDLSVLSGPNYTHQGGSGLVLYRVSEAALADGGRDGVQAGEWFFPGYPVDPQQPQKRVALYAAPYDLEEGAEIVLTAIDPYGNETAQRFLDRYFVQPLRTATIPLSDAFFEQVVPEIMAQTPELEDEGDLLQNYLQINRDLRQRNARTLVQLAEQSPPEWLWEGAFLQLPNSQVTSSFADRRTYVYDGKSVDQQDHLGFDLASTRRAEVPAANAGIVRLARYFGIYGRTVVVDHGFGLMSLYSHLSTIDVEEGERVEKGQILGRTGETGLAAGDHLHFTMMIHGLAVNPIEWWDPQWIEHRVLDVLKQK